MAGRVRFDGECEQNVLGDFCVRARKRLKHSPVGKSGEHAMMSPFRMTLLLSVSIVVQHSDPILRVAYPRQHQLRLGCSQDWKFSNLR